MRILYWLFQFSVVQTLSNNEFHTPISAEKVESEPVFSDLLPFYPIPKNEFTRAETNLISEALDDKKPESKEVIQAITELCEIYPDLAKRYFTFHGKNRTIFHSASLHNRPVLTLELMKSSLGHFSMRDALPNEPRALKYLLPPLHEEKMSAENRTQLIQFALKYTDINQDGNHILIYAIGAGSYPSTIIAIANLTSGLAYHPNFTLPPLGLVLTSKISEFKGGRKWLNSTIEALTNAGADVDEQFPFQKSPNVTLLNWLCSQTTRYTEKSEQKNYLQNLIFTQVSLILQQGADASLIDEKGMNACQTARYYDNTFLFELLDCHINFQIFNKIWQYFFNKEFIALFITSLLGVWAFNYITGKKNELDSPLPKLVGKFLAWYCQDPELINNLTAFKENKLILPIPQKTAAKEKLKPAKIEFSPTKTLKKSIPEIKTSTAKDVEAEFWNACAQGHLETGQALAKEIKNYNFIKNKSTPLIIAVRNRHLQIVEFLLSLPEIDCDWITPENETALLIACRQSSKSIFQLLYSHIPLPRLNKNSTVKTGTIQSQQDELIAATIDAMLKNFKDDPLTLDFLSVFIKDGQIPLTLYWGENSDYLISHLLYQELFDSFKLVLNQINQFSHLGLINCTNSKERTPLMIACQSKNDIFAQHLLDHAKSLKVHLEDKEGESALLKAIRHQKIELANNLILKDCPLTEDIRRTVKFKKLKSEDQEKLIESFNELNPRKEEKKPQPHIEPKKPKPRKRIFKRITKEKPKDRTLPSDKIERKKNNPSFQPNNFEQKYELDNTYHNEFPTLIVKALGNLIAADDLKPISAQELCYQHHQKTLYILEILKIVVNYDRYLNNNRLDKRNRIIGNESVIRTLKELQLTMHHNTLPLLVTGQFIDEVNETTRDLIRWMGKDVVPTIVDSHIRKFNFSNKQRTELYALMGNKDQLIETKTTTIFDIRGTVLYKILTDFHRDFQNRMSIINLEQEQRNYIWNYALEMIITKYQKKITNGDAVKNNFRNWHEIILLLMSCGDISTKKQNHYEIDFKLIDHSPSKMKNIREKRTLLIQDFSQRFEKIDAQESKPNVQEFMRDCRRLVRNFLIHDADSLLMISDLDNLIFSKLCQYAKHLWDQNRQFVTKINWKENLYGQYYQRLFAPAKDKKSQSLSLDFGHF